MNLERSCPTCGAQLPADAPEGLCPRCLLEHGLADGGPAQHVITRAAGSPGVRVALEELQEALPDLYIEGILGEGGMGVVFRARQRRLDRTVAVKVLPASFSSDPAFTERFAREARALASLSHPNIVTVHDFGTAGDLHYLVMEYVEGATLRQLLQGEKLPPEQALAIVPQICDALQYAHDQGIVHRDVKPENILLDLEGRVKIADFGLAKLSQRQKPGATLTGTGQVMGTLHYMAPEQLERPLEVDHRADIFALGVVFYELLTGGLPVGRFSPPSKKAGVDERLDGVVLRALEEDPADRYQKASEVRTDVEGLEGKPRPAAAPQRDAARAPESIAMPGSSRKLSGLAIASALGATLPIVLAVLVLALISLLDSAQRASGDGGSGFSLAPLLILAPLGLFFCLGAIGGTIGGFVSLNRIRDRWPELYGVGAAAIGAWTWPLVVADAVVLAIAMFMFQAVGLGERDETKSVISVIALVLIAADALFVVLYRIHFLRRVKGR